MELNPIDHIVEVRLWFFKMTFVGSGKGVMVGG